MKQNHLLKSLLLLCALIVGSMNVWAETKTYQHVFSAKPSTGSSVALSGINWAITAENLNNYNSTNYAGVQIGTSSKNGSITLTSVNNWGEQSSSTFYGYKKITEVRLWLNLGGTSVTPTVTIDGKAATSDGTTVVKNSSAGSDWTKATKVTFTPAANGNTGIVVINVATVKAGYICAMEIDCEEMAKTDPTISFTDGSVHVGRNLDLSTLFTTNSDGGVTYSIIDGDSYASLDGSTLTGVAEGTVTVKAEQAATVSYNAGEATATITVTPALVLSSIAVTTAPTKTDYTEGETFDPTGMVVTATYNDKSEDDVTTGITYTPDGALTTSDTEITISYTENGVTKTATQAITVNEVVDYATLPFSWDGGTSSELDAVVGVTAIGLGSDYADSNAPYRVKLDNTGDYILIKTNAQPGQVTIGVKMIGGSNTSSIKVQGSSNGETYTDLETLSISGSQNDVLTLKTTKSFAADVRYVKLVFTKGSNVGVGPISISVANVTITPSKDKTTYVTTQPLDFSGVDGLTAYVATGSTSSAVTLTIVDKVPAGTPLVLKGTASTAYNVPTTAEADTPTTNYLVAGTGAAISAGDDAAHTRYVLSGGVFKKITTTPATVPVGKAYLEINESTLGAPELELNFDGENSDDITTGIDTIEHSTLNIEHSEVYNLNGQRVSQPTKGLYIVNGKKVIVK